MLQKLLTFPCSKLPYIQDGSFADFIDFGKLICTFRVYETSYFQIFFDKKKHNRNYIKRKENKQDKLPLQLTNVEEIEVQEIKENKRIVNKDRFEKLVTAFVIESGQDENDRIQRNIASTVLRQKYIIEEEI